MSERMSAADVSFFYRETRSAPQHVGGIAVFQPPADGFDYDRLVRLLEERISLVPRYRQRVRPVPGHIANPVWIDDPTFDITYHVRRSALPQPGTRAQLLEFAARIQSRLLDRNRPLWEMYLVEGLADGLVAVVTKTHEAMIDGTGAVDIVQVILDEAPEPRRTVEALWMPGPEPSATSLVADAVSAAARHPMHALDDAARLGTQDARAVAQRVGATVGGVVTGAAELVRGKRVRPLSAKLGEQRRIAVASTCLDDYRAVRRVHGGTVNDVVLATVTGALRHWFVQRGVPVAPTMHVRAMAPVSVTSGPDDTLGGRVTGLLVDLPIGEPDPLRRLTQIGFALAAHRASGRSVSAHAMTALAGFAPPTLHALGARAANGLARRPFDLVITNVPGPQLPLYAAGARMTEIFPLIPLNPGQSVSIGLSSYDGGVYYGVLGDRDAVPDIDILADALAAALADLVAASPDPNPRGPARERRPVRRVTERRAASRREPSR